MKDIKDIRKLADLLVVVVNSGTDELLWDIVNKVDLPSINSVPVVNAAILKGDLVKTELLLTFGTARPVIESKHIDRWKAVNPKIVSVLEVANMLPLGYYALLDTRTPDLPETV